MVKYCFPLMSETNLACKQNLPTQNSGLSRTLIDKNGVAQKLSKTSSSRLQQEL